MTFVNTARELQRQFLAKSPTFSTEARSGKSTHVLPKGRGIENLYPPIRASALEFFEERRIKWWRSPLSGDDVKATGPTQNMVSSQVACVNYLLPLASHRSALVAMLRAIDGDVVDVVSIEYDLPDGEPASSFVELEWVGLAGSLEGASVTRGMHVTSADALLIGQTEQGRHRAYLFEWKNAECYSPDDNKGLGKSGQTRKKRYEALYRASDSPFNNTESIDALLYEPFYQLMRLGLLGAKMVRDRELAVSEARVVVVCPEANREYRGRITSPDLRSRSFESVELVMRSVARNPEMFRIVDPASLAKAIKPVGGADTEGWLGYHSDRYGWPSAKE